ncbi:substrate-binding periplasmic protein [Magnetococcus sp. PR-3]|uniref:substrate-binding periplasmic protein n=1 Tax=Magnetococcus sp. PR-3 TaxID=3120355 RepID=UPI002FCDE2A7
MSVLFKPVWGAGLRGVWIVWLSLLLLPPIAHGQPVDVPLLTYHTHPPFILNEDQGLSHDLARWLTQQSEGRYRFTVQSVSRPYLNRWLTTEQVALVPWVHPVWFKDKAQHRYHWSQIPLMKGDSNVLVARKDRLTSYSGPASLDGLVLGGVYGHHYKAIDPYIERSGALRRVNASNLQDNINKLLNGHVDVTLMPRSAARYFLAQLSSADSPLHVLPQQHQVYDRYLMVAGGNADLKHWVNQQLANKTYYARWQAYVARYQ